MSWFGGLLLVCAIAVGLFYLLLAIEKLKARRQSGDSATDGESSQSDGSPVAPTPELDYSYETYVAGVTKRGRQEVAAEVRYGDRLTLGREPDNKHDPNAVSVWSHFEQLGYIPERYSRMAAEYLDAGRSVEAVVSDIVDLDEDQYGSDKLGIHITLSFYR